MVWCFPFRNRSLCYFDGLTAEKIEEEVQESPALQEMITWREQLGEKCGLDLTAKKRMTLIN